MGFFSNFGKFIARGNVVDLAVGVIIGAAFGKIVTSLVQDVLMPIINPLVPGGDWRNLEVHGIKIGSFLGNVLDFLIIAFVIYLIVTAFSKLHKKEEEKPKEPSAEEKLLTEIRDILKSK